MTDRIDTAALRRAWGETSPIEWTVLRSNHRRVQSGRFGTVANFYEKSGPYGISYEQAVANARFIALAHREWPALLDRIDALEAENARLRSALQPFAKSGELLVKAGDSGRFWAYRPAGGDEYGITGTHLLDARTALGDPS